MKKAACIMIQGTMSGAGKSLLCAALCRIFRQDGFKAAPFKSQNMALNSHVTREGLEIGRAQAVQAEAAGIEPDVRMNPVLLKPSSDTGSQVIVNGKARGHMSAADYFRYKKELVPDILRAYESLASEFDVIVIEGAGSPAEINLRAHDIVNMGLAELVDAPVILAGDIDRGGVFAQLYGTAALLQEEERARVKGFVINKFRGDVSLLTPGVTRIEELTGIPVLGVVPWLKADIEEEDSLAPELSVSRREDGEGLDIAVIRLPRISNFTDFAPLRVHPGMRVRYVGSVKELGEPDLLILPGTKSTMADLLWMRQNGLETAVLRLAGRGTPVLGICGGYQMLGEEIRDPDGVEGALPVLPGMGLLPCTTVFSPEKHLTRVSGKISGWLMDGAGADGYEIHMGETKARGLPFVTLLDGRTDGCLSADAAAKGLPDQADRADRTDRTDRADRADRTDQADRTGEGGVLAAGTYLHGLFDRAEAVQALYESLCRRKGTDPEAAGHAETREAYKERQYDMLADGVRAALDMEAVYRIAGLKKP